MRVIKKEHNQEKRRDKEKMKMIIVYKLQEDLQKGLKN